MTKRCIVCQCSRNLRFHELPSDATLREKWLAIVPSNEVFGENPKVCELHFDPSNYEPHCKRRILKRDVVPLVIPRQELEAAAALKESALKEEVALKKAALQKVALKELDLQTVEGNSDVSVDGPSCSIQEKSLGLKKLKSQLHKVGLKIQTPKTVGKVTRKFEILKAQLGHLKEDNREKTSKIKSLCSELKELKSLSFRQASEVRNRDKSLRQMQAKVRQLERLVNAKDLGTSNVKEKIEKEKREKEEQLKKIRNLKDQVELLSTERKEMEQICYYKNIEEMILNMDTDRKAAFILDQIKMYNMKVPRYSDSTLQECIIWEDTDPRGYQFVRESELLTLPSQNTMKKHLGPMDLEINLNKTFNFQSNKPPDVAIQAVV